MSAATLNELAGLLDHITERAAVAAAPGALKAAQSDWAAQRSPDGTPWAPRKDGSATTIGGYLGGATCEARGSTVVLEVPDALKPHQGGGRIPRRATIPGRADPIPEHYEAPCAKALEEELGALA